MFLRCGEVEKSREYSDGRLKGVGFYYLGAS